MVYPPTDPSKLLTRQHSVGCSPKQMVDYALLLLILSSFDAEVALSKSDKNLMGSSKH